MGLIHVNDVVRRLDRLLVSNLRGNGYPCDRLATEVPCDWALFGNTD